MNSNEDNSMTFFCMEFVQEFGLCTGLGYDLFYLVLCTYLSLHGWHILSRFARGGGGGKVTLPAPTYTYWIPGGENAELLRTNV